MDITNLIVTVAAVIFVFGLLVFVHELGHFVVAKMSGMKVTEFALGFGPSIFKKQYGETLYAIRIIPLGGYNKIAGMDPDEEEDPRNFNNHSVIKRLAVIVAGSTMNFILPIVLFFIVISSTGIHKPVDLPILGNVMAGQPASLAGLQDGDEVLLIEGQKVATWTEFVDKIKVRTNEPTELLVKREDKELNLSVTPKLDDKGERAIIGVLPTFEIHPVTTGEALKASVMQTYNIGIAMLKGLYSIVFEKDKKADLAGPLGIVQMTSKVAETGFLPLLDFAAVLSINLGLINLFPVPMLDGGHVVTLLLEAVRGKPLSDASMQKIQYIGFVLLISLMIFATMNDIGRLF